MPRPKPTTLRRILLAVGGVATITAGCLLNAWRRANPCPAGAGICGRYEGDHPDSRRWHAATGVRRDVHPRAREAR